MSDKIKVLRDLLNLKEQIRKLKHTAIIKDAKCKKQPVDSAYTRLLRIFNKIVDNQIDQINNG